MNVQLHVVISDITGTTGQRILRDIVNGQADPQHLAKHRDARGRASEAEIAAALTGNYRLEHLFVLKQNLELYDMSRWPTEDHFASWVTLASHNKITGGRLISSRTQPSANRAADILRVAAMSVGYTQTALGAFYRHLASRISKAKANTATARKLAILVYRVLKGEIVYKDPGAAAYDVRHRETVVRRLRRQAAVLGFGLVNGQTRLSSPSACRTQRWCRASIRLGAPRAFYVRRSAAGPALEGECHAEHSAAMDTANREPNRPAGAHDRSRHSHSFPAISLYQSPDACSGRSTSARA